MGRVYLTKEENELYDTVEAVIKRAHSTLRPSSYRDLIHEILDLVYGAVQDIEDPYSSGNLKKKASSLSENEKKALEGILSKEEKK